MATAPRKSTAQSRTRSKSGAAPAVPANKTDTVESDAPLAVSADTDMSAMERAEHEADAEDARQQTQAKADQAAVQASAAGETRSPRVEETPIGSTAADNEPPKITEGLHGPAGTREEPVATRDLVDPEPAAPVAGDGGELTDPEANSPDAPPARDLEVLKALADTSGRDPVTPYAEGGVPAPSPVQVMPVLKNTYDWTREGDTGAVGRVLVDGLRVQVNGYYRLALKGDRIIAPADVIEASVKRGVMLKEG